jgi:hypothetical protein
VVISIFLQLKMKYKATINNLRLPGLPRQVFADGWREYRSALPKRAMPCPYVASGLVSIRLTVPSSCFTADGQRSGTLPQSSRACWECWTKGLTDGGAQVCGSG